MSGPGTFLFFTGLLTFALALILLVSSGESRSWWMWLLLFFGIFLLIWGAMLWIVGSAFNTLNQSGAFQGIATTGSQGGLLAEAEEAAIFL